MKAEDLSFDLVEFGNKLGNWHGGPGDAIYAVGAYARLGEPHPQRAQVVGCIAALEHLHRRTERDSADFDELCALLANADELLKLYPIWVWGEEEFETKELAEEAIAETCAAHITVLDGIVTYDGVDYVASITVELVTAEEKK